MQSEEFLEEFFKQREQEIEEKIKYQECYQNCFLHSEFIPENKLDTQFVYENLDTLNFLEKANLISNIINEQQVNKLLLNYELKNLDLSYLQKQENKENLDISLVKGILNRYSLLWENILDEHNWIYYEKENRHIFENSINIKYNIKQDQVKEIIRSLTRILNSINNNYKFKFKYIEDDKNACFWVLFVVNTISQ